MWLRIETLIIISILSSTTSHEKIFNENHTIFSSTFNITKILVPGDFARYVQTEYSNSPSIFFTISDPKLDGGFCIYVLENYALYEILEGGRDSTADYSSDPHVYFGAKDGIYKYDPESLSAKRIEHFNDNIIQIQKANGTDRIYYLTIQNQLFVLENNGTVKTKVQNVVCATQFVLDTSNNIYFVECGNFMIYVIKSNETGMLIPASVTEEFREIQLLRPAFLMDECIPFFGDGLLYILYANGIYEKKDFQLEETPSAYSVDAGLYLVAALNGKIYELNVMEVLLKSMFVTEKIPKGVANLVMSVISSSKDSLFAWIV